MTTQITPDRIEKAAEYLFKAVLRHGGNLDSFQGLTIVSYMDWLKAQFSISSSNPAYYYDIQRSFEEPFLGTGDLYCGIEAAIALIPAKVEARKEKIVKGAKAILEAEYPLNLSGYEGRIVRSPHQVDIELHEVDGIYQPIVFTCVTINELTGEVSGFSSHHRRMVC